MSQSYNQGYQKIGANPNGNVNVESAASSSSVGGVSHVDVRITEEELMSNNGSNGSSFHNSSFFRNGPVGDMYNSGYNWRKFFKFALGAAVLYLLLSMFIGNEGDKEDSNQHQHPTTTGTVVPQNAEKSPASLEGSTTNLYETEMDSRNEKNAAEATKIAQGEDMTVATPRKGLHRGCETTVMLIRHCETFVDDVVKDRYLKTHCNYVGFERAEYLTYLFGPMGPSTSEDEDNKRRLANQKSGQNGGLRVRDPNEGLTGFEVLEDIAIDKEVTGIMINDAFAKQALKPKYPYPAFLYASNPFSVNKQNNNDYSAVETLTPLSHKYDVKINQKFSSRNVKDFGTEFIGLLNSGNVCGKTVLVAWAAEGIPELAAEIGCGAKNGCPESYADDKDFDALWQIKFVFDPPLNPKYLQGVDAENLTAAQQNLSPRHEHKGWEVWGSIRQQGFDPLQFSTVFSDYDTKKGVKSGGKWMVSYLPDP